jgi:lipopolysaccharide/colanic/teichoic acid biosynthesis glycosyltransferase
MFGFTGDSERGVTVPRLAASPPVTVPWYRRGRPLPSDSTEYLRWKRFFDVVFSILLLPLVLPIIACCSLAIAMDSPGRPLFTQWRTGRGGYRFRMYKLRTMVLEAEEMKSGLSGLNLLSWPDFKIASDPRVTRVGHILRKTSLDELPQIFNVLRGDMSLIGPRPTSFSHATYQAWHTARLDVQPGLSGLWQVEGRNELGFDERCRLDIAYARHRSLKLDAQILLRTVPRVLSGRGAN